MDCSLLDFCRQLIGIEGVSGSEKQVADRLEEEMLHKGFDRVDRDPYGNVIGMIEGTLPGSLMFEGHMDSVGIQDRSLWRYSPFGHDFINNRLYGRGTSDMLCALGAMIHALGDLATEGKRNHATLYLVAVVQEEIFEGIGFGKVLDLHTPDAVVLGEASELKLMLGQKGRCELRIETFGKNAHSAHPERGRNAIELMAKVLHRIPQMTCHASPLLGEGIMVVTDIISRPYPGSSVIPDHCQITIDRRTLEQETKETVLSEMRQELSLVFPDSQERLPACKCTIPTASALCYTGERLGGERFFPAWMIDEDTPLVGFAREAMGRVGIPFDTGYYPFCTDGSESAGNRNIPTIGFGPSSPSLAHIIDEYVEFNQVLVARQVYREIAKIFRAN